MIVSHDCSCVFQINTSIHCCSSLQLRQLFIYVKHNTKQSEVRLAFYKQFLIPLIVLVRDEYRVVKKRVDS